MKLHEEFSVAHDVEDVWKFFEQPEAVAACMPGVESVTVLDEDNVQVRATQSIGPMSATFEAKVAVLERVPLELIRFRVTGRSVRGAIGNLRTENTLGLSVCDGGTLIALDGELALAGALGSVGQKVVAKQAGKVTAEFSANLERALNGEPPVLASRAAPGRHGEGSGAGGVVALHAGEAAVAASDRWSAERWSKIAAAMSAASAVLSLLTLVRVRFGSRRSPDGGR